MRGNNHIYIYNGRSCFIFLNHFAERSIILFLKYPVSAATTRLLIQNKPSHLFEIKLSSNYQWIPSLNVNRENIEAHLKLI
jgi:hypothetical protein